MGHELNALVPGGLGPDQLRRPVAGTIVDHDDLVVLAQPRGDASGPPDGLDDVRLLVVGREDNGEVPRSASRRAISGRRRGSIVGWPICKLRSPHDQPPVPGVARCRAIPSLLPDRSSPALSAQLTYDGGIVRRPLILILH